MSRQDQKSADELRSRSVSGLQNASELRDASGGSGGFRFPGGFKLRNATPAHLPISKNRQQSRRIRIWAILFWIVVWQILSSAVGHEFLLPEPRKVIAALGILLTDAEFYLSVLTSVGRISFGFLFGFVVACISAPVSVRFRAVRELLAPLIFTVKTIPVASFIILILIWASSKELPVIISFLMVFPILYTNVYTGIVNTDPKLLEFSRVFELGRAKEIRFIYLPEIMPLLTSGASVAAGLAWKAGIAAEIIGLPKSSIGEHLYHAKIYLDTENLFAWTLVIICLSILFEKLFMAALHKIARSLQHRKKEASW